jgi:hypothetical protein
VEPVLEEPLEPEPSEEDELLRAFSLALLPVVPVVPVVVDEPEP